MIRDDNEPKQLKHSFEHDWTINSMNMVQDQIS